ncbi:MAG TPA: NAD-dependent epimerase/dehydratase family protein [Micromonosporaceae bacterium]|nr:NAD-dependent epimerase/dehydratase family protein [Micromonosporaceae bacterium]
MALHVIVGAGAIGSGAARLLADAGEQVRLLSRRGTGPEHPAIELIAADASDTDRLSRLTDGAVALYNCANPAYHRWLTDWPPMAAAMLTAAERSGAVLAITGNLYGYGPVDGPITEDTPLAATNPKLRVRADMWRTALAASQAGRVRVTEVRGSDYVGPNSPSLISMYVLPAVAKGRAVQLPASLDLPHTFTYTDDMARTLVALAADERAWGSGWHVPSNPAVTVREIVDRACLVGGLPAPKLRSLPIPVVRVAELVSVQLRELRHTEYQWRRPFVMDSSRTQDVFGIRPTDLDEALRRAVEPLAVGRASGAEAR